MNLIRFTRQIPPSSPNQPQQVIRDSTVLLSNDGVLPSSQQWKNSITINLDTEYKWLDLMDNHA